MIPRVRFSSRPPLRLIGVGVIACAVVTGAAVAAQPPGTAINACAAKSTGALRVIDTSKKGTAGNCRSSEREIMWGINGPPGSPGAAGAAGPAGPAGEAGVAGAPGVVGPAGGASAGVIAGPIGPAGQRGTPGPTGPPGAVGPVSNHAPGGLAQVGVVSARTNSPDAGTLEADINFPLLIDGGVAEHFLAAGETSTPCPGSAAAPTAAAGHLCVYSTNIVRRVSGANFVDPVAVAGGQTNTQSYGTILRFDQDAGSGDAWYYGVWAATAH